MSFRFNPFTGTLDIVGDPSQGPDKIITANVGLNNIDTSLYHGNIFQIVVIDNDGNVVTE